MMTAAMHEGHRGAVVPRQVPVTPSHQRDDDRVQIAARVGQVVLVPRRVVAVPASFEYARTHERAEPVREGVP